MSLFKEKKTKIGSCNYKRVTIDAKHTEFTKQFQDNKIKLEEKKLALNDIESEFEKLKKKDKIDMTDQEINDFFEYNEKRKQLEKDIKDIEQNKDETSYYLDTAHLMFNYYDKFQNNKTNGNTNSYKTFRNNDSKSVLDFFQKNQVNTEEANIIQDIPNKQSFKNQNSKSDIINSYLMKVEDNFIYPFEFDNSLEYCKKCNREKSIIASEGIIVCTSCGQQKYNNNR